MKFKILCHMATQQWILCVEKKGFLGEESEKELAELLKPLNSENADCVFEENNGRGPRRVLRKEQLGCSRMLPDSNSGGRNQNN